MRILLLFICLSFSMGVQSFAQERTGLKNRIDQLTSRILSNIDKDVLFIKTDHSYISDEDFQAIKKIIMTNGFPTISMVGKETSHQFWMLVQLCDRDPRMQMAVMTHMSYLMRSGEVIKEDFVMLSDRARMNKALPQLYGTQFVISDVGTVLLHQTHDLENIDVRRKAMGLTRFEEYEESISAAIARKTTASAEYDEYSTN